MSFLSYLPSPGSAAIHIGPLQLRAYGLMIALGVIIGVRIWGKRMTLIGVGGPEEAASIATWAVPAGVIGARLYHVATEWDRFSGQLFDIVKIWKGGLGIPGGVLLGAIVGVMVAKKRNIDIGQMLWAVAPAIPVAQAIGRLGNWWNQELFGRPTTLPWALKIDAEKIPDGYAPGTLFHPTFLYEATWNLALAGVLIIVGRRMMHSRPGRLMALYVGGYGLGRFWVEGLRIDPAKSGGGLRLNQWVAIAMMVGCLVYLVIDMRKAKSITEPNISEPSVIQSTDYRQEDVESN
jgi:prolipoprotein diacylglyceryl transferase